MSTAENIWEDGWKRKESRLLWPRQSPDLNRNKMLWWDFQRAVHERMPTNFNELRQRCQAEWAEIPLQWCERWIMLYRKCLLQFTNGDSTSDWIMDRIFSFTHSFYILAQLLLVSCLLSIWGCIYLILTPAQDHLIFYYVLIYKTLDLRQCTFLPWL